MEFKGSVHNNSNREMRENHESLCVLFLLVRAVRVVRGSWNSKGVAVVFCSISLLGGETGGGQGRKENVFHGTIGKPWIES